MCSGIPPSSSILSTFVYDISYCKVKPTKSNILSESPLSSAYRSILLSLSTCPISGHGAKHLSHQIRGLLFRQLQRIFMPRLDIPISYVSGKQKAKRASILLLSLIISLSSPPVYLDGFVTFFKNFHAFCFSVIFCVFFIPSPYYITNLAILYFSTFEGFCKDRRIVFLLADFGLFLAKTGNFLQSATLYLHFSAAKSGRKVPYEDKPFKGLLAP